MRRVVNPLHIPDADFLGLFFADADWAVPQARIRLALNIERQHATTAAAVVFIVLFRHGIADVVVEDGTRDDALGGNQMVRHDFQLVVQHPGILRRVNRLVGVVGRDKIRALLQHEQDGLGHLREAGRNERHLSLLAAKPCGRVVRLDGFVETAVASGIDAVGIVQGFVAVDAHVQAEERRKALDERLHLRLEIVLPVRADADTSTTRKGAAFQGALLEKVIADVRNQRRFQQGLAADEVKNDGFRLFADEAAGLIFLPHTDKQIDNALAGFKAHGFRAFVVLVAVIAPQIALVRDLERHLAHQRAVCHAGVQPVDEVVIIRQTRQFPHG